MKPILPYFIIIVKRKMLNFYRNLTIHSIIMGICIAARINPPGIKHQSGPAPWWSMAVLKVLPLYVCSWIDLCYFFPA
jgi:hypothetical protein